MSQIAAILAKARELTGQQPFRYRFSKAGEPCLRALVYDAHDADDGKQQADTSRSLKLILHVAAAHAIAAKIEEAAKLCGCETQSAVEFDTGAVRVSGSLDISRPMEWVLDIKIVNDKQWARIPRAKDWLQVHSYAVAKDCPRAGLLYGRLGSLGDDSSDFEYREFWEPASVERAQELCGVWEQVEHYRKLRTLPERVWGASPKRWPCAWCRHLSRCGPTEEK